jgi:hypothetical protein
MPFFQTTSPFFEKETEVVAGVSFLPPHGLADFVLFLSFRAFRQDQQRHIPTS